MVDSTKFAEFIESAHDKLDLFKFSLLRHEKNPDDREFLNDISRSIRAIKEASLPMGLGRISELCFHLESMLTLFRRNRLDVDQETINLLQDGKDRLAKLTHEIETMQKERATIKDLLKRIKKFEDSVTNYETMEPAPVLEVLEMETEKEEVEPDLSLLPEEIKNEEYDEELFLIFIDQMQENLSLLRSLTTDYLEKSNKSKGVAICSDLVGKLQTSANYMGYEELADFYLQWIAELEMSGVELSVGSPVSLDYMEANLKRITALFPQIKDIPADETLVDKAWQDFTVPVPKKREPKVEEKSDSESFKDLFSNIDVSSDIFDTESEPIAALSGVETLIDEPATPEKTKPAVKKITKAAPVDIDGSFLEEERQSYEFDEELFHIFLQQLQENLSQIRSLTDSYPQATNKSKVVDLCSKLVGNLQSSANYMGYEQLAEYHLQWIAELELAGVDLSIGHEITFDFMAEKIKKMTELFPQIENVSSELTDFSILKQETVPEKPQEEISKDDDKDDSEAISDIFDTQPDDEKDDIVKQAEDPDPTSALDEDDFLFGEFDDGTDESFEFGAEPIAALTDDQPPDESLFEKVKTSVTSTPVDVQPEEDIGVLFGDIDEDGTVLKEAPIRKELFQELSKALRSLDDEPTTEETSSEDIPRRNIDETGLFEKLLSALDSTAGDDDTSGVSSPIDQVIEEILTGETQPVSRAPVHGTMPMQLSTPEILQSPGLDAGKIDDLVNKIGELVTNRSSLSQLHSEMNDLHHNLLAIDGLDTLKLAPLKELISRLGNANTALGQVFGEIKDGILKVRMTPIGHLFDLYQQFVPELAQEADKKIHFTTRGNETEIDHCSIEDIGSCLLILIRNAVEHGIELPSEREHSDKKSTASLTLNAFLEHHQVVLEVSDDGQGIDPKKIKAIALAKDLFTGDDLYTMSDNDLTRLIMTPGFSTDPNEMTERGPGMDTLKTIVEKLNGTVRIKSSVGKGTTIRLSIPFNPPIFQTLKFTDGSSSYAVPLTNIEEVLRVQKDDLVQSGGAECILSGDENIPVISLSDMIETHKPLPERSARFHVIVLSADTKKIGLIVDTIIGLEDVSIRPLAEFLREQSGFSAAAIKGEGEISFIPDVAGLIKKASEKHLN